VPWSDATLGVYRWLAAQPGDFPIVELPLGAPDEEGAYMALSTYHWKRLVNGRSSFTPAAGYLRAVLGGFPDPESLRLLHGLGVRYAIVHRESFFPLTLNLSTGEPAVSDRLLGKRGLCDGLGPWFASYLALRYADAETCAVEILGAPPPPPRPPDRLLSLAGARFSASSGEDPRAVADGDPGSHWVQAVRSRAPGWLQIDLPEPHHITRAVVHLGHHFGEYLRAYQVAASRDGLTWDTIVDRPVGEAPLRQLLTRPDDLVIEIPLPRGETKHLRLVRPRPSRARPAHLYKKWPSWGVHEIELYEATGLPG
jgi:hypothetical protein